MTRLKTLQPRLRAQGMRLAALTTADTRIRGTELTERRKRKWQENPNCAQCGRLTVYPWGFELDHVIPLYQGGEDTYENTQILCSGPDGCHRRKTAEERKRS